MKKALVLLFFILFLTSCSQNNNSAGNSTNATNSTVITTKELANVVSKTLNLVQQQTQANSHLLKIVNPAFFNNTLKELKVIKQLLIVICFILSFSSLIIIAGIIFSFSKYKKLKIEHDNFTKTMHENIECIKSNLENLAQHSNTLEQNIAKFDSVAKNMQQAITSAVAYNEKLQALNLEKEHVINNLKNTISQLKQLKQQSKDGKNEKIN